MFLALLLFFSSHSAFAAEDCQSVLIEDFGGSVEVHGEDGSSALIPDETLEEGESITTAEDSWADLRYCDGSTMRVGENSEYKYEGAEPKGSYWKWGMQLIKGSLRAIVEKDGGAEKIKVIISTPHASMGVRGTEFVVDSDASQTDLHTLEGDVLMGAKDDSPLFYSEPVSSLAQKFQSVKENSMSQLAGSAKKPSKPVAFERVAFLKEREKRALFRKALLKGKKNDFRERVKKRRAVKLKLKAKRQLRRQQLQLPGKKNLVPGPSPDRFKTRRRNN